MTSVPAGSRSAEGTKSGVNKRAILAVVLAVIGLIFVFQNSGSGRVHILFWSLTMPTWIWILIVLVLGVVIGSLFPWFRPKKKAVR